MGPKKILVVDDDQELSGLLELRLKREGYTVKSSNRGEMVVEASKSFSPDIILMDILLEDMDGAEVVKLLQQDEQTSGIPVVFLSGIVARESLEGDLIKVNNRLYPAIAKPFTVENLLQLLKDQLN